MEKLYRDIDGERVELTPEQVAAQLAEWESPDTKITPPAATPQLVATLGVTIAEGMLTSVEMAAQLQGAYYEPGYLQVGFATGRIPPNYLVFVQCDVPATMTQYKSEDGFELVFADGNGDPVNPGRLDIQLLEVR